MRRERKNLDKVIAIICIVISVIYLIVGGYIYVKGQVKFYLDIINITQIISMIALALFAFCGLVIFIYSYIAIRKYKKIIVESKKDNK